MFSTFAQPSLNERVAILEGLHAQTLLFPHDYALALGSHELYAEKHLRKSEGSTVAEADKCAKDFTDKMDGLVVGKDKYGVNSLKVF
jgi:hypothetical protein